MPQELPVHFTHLSDMTPIERNVLEDFTAAMVAADIGDEIVALVTNRVLKNTW